MRPLESSDLRQRLIPFTVTPILAAVLIAVNLIEVSLVRALLASALIAAAFGTALFVPWRRLPAMAQMTPALLALAGLALAIAGDDSPGLSPLVILVIGPVLWLALYHDTAQVRVGVAAAGLAVAVGGSIAGLDAAEGAAAAAVTMASCAVLALITSQLLNAERAAARAAELARDQHRLVLDHLPDTVIAHMDSGLRWVSLEGGAMAVARDEVIGKHYDDLMPKNPNDPLRAAYVAALAGDETRLDHVSPTTGRVYAIEVLPVRDTGGAISVARDITEERAAAERLEASERDHRLLTESARDMISRQDVDGTFLFVSAASQELLGYAPDDLLGRRCGEFVVPEDRELMERARARLSTLGHATSELRMTRNDGTVVWVEQRLRKVGDEIHSTARDVTARREADRQLSHLATHDDLTGMWNRRRFNEALREELARAHRRGPDAVMLLIDLDAFKAVNDTHGHATGDRLLVAVGDAIRSRMREGDAGGRLGGDEFAVLLRGTASEQAEHVAEIYGEAIAAASIDVDGASLSPRASVGWAVVAADALDERSVLAGADAAMYRQKALRRESA